MTIFDIRANKADGSHRDYTRAKINHALRTLWRQKNLLDAHITFRDNRRVKWWIFGKFERKRAIATGLDGVEMPSGRPGVENHMGWLRLPNKWNKIK